MALGICCLLVSNCDTKPSFCLSYNFVTASCIRVTRMGLPVEYGRVTSWWSGEGLTQGIDRWEDAVGWYIEYLGTSRCETENNVFFVEISFTRCNFHWERSRSNSHFSKIWDLKLDRGYTKWYIICLRASYQLNLYVCLSIKFSPTRTLHGPTNGSSDILPLIPRSLPERYLIGFLALAVQMNQYFHPEGWRYPLDLKTRKLLSTWIFRRGLNFGQFPTRRWGACLFRSRLSASLKWRW